MLDTILKKITVCQYDETCEHKTSNCRENTMTTELHANPIIADKFWIVEADGEKVATLRKNEDNRYVMSNNDGI